MVGNIVKKETREMPCSSVCLRYAM